jgi:hypothetical protein
MPAPIISTVQAVRHLPGRLPLAAGLGAAALAALAARALWWEPRRLRVRTCELSPPRWPARLDGLRLAVVSDLHAGAPQVSEAAVARVAAAVERLRPDAVVLLGDFVDRDVAGGTDVEPEAVARGLAPLTRLPHGALAVLGNHDWLYDGPRVAAALTAVGVRVLENDAVAVGRGPRRWWAAGVADASTRAPRLDAALTAVPDDEPVVLLSHDPDVFPQVPDRVSVTLSGHTHGGQVAIPGLRGLWTPSRHGGRYARGHVVEGARHLVISRGIGTSRWPVRLGAPPELVLLVLRGR